MFMSESKTVRVGRTAAREGQRGAGQDKSASTTADSGALELGWNRAELASPDGEMSVWDVSLLQKAKCEEPSAFCGD